MLKYAAVMAGVAVGVLVLTQFQPVPSDTSLDRDSDGRADPVLWNPDTGHWRLGADDAVLGEPGDVPVPADWDGDGRVDLILNGMNAEFWRNVGTGNQWRFRNEGPVSQLRLAGHTTCPTVADFDGDGRPDLILGAEDGFFYYLPNPWAADASAAASQP